MPSSSTTVLSLSKASNFLTSFELVAPMADMDQTSGDVSTDSTGNLIIFSYKISKNNLVMTSPPSVVISRVHWDLCVSVLKLVLGHSFDGLMGTIFIS